VEVGDLKGLVRREKKNKREETEDRRKSMKRGKYRW
jgi:hypothetical protein